MIWGIFPSILILTDAKTAENTKSSKRSLPLGGDISGPRRRLRSLLANTRYAYVAYTYVSPGMEVQRSATSPQASDIAVGKATSFDGR